jgi:single-stranded-DNA-specific exonuclease
MEKWVLKNKKADFGKIVKEHKVSEVLARLLVNRDVFEDDDINRFLNSNLDDLHAPIEMKDMNKAKLIVCDKIRNNEKVRIVGDYDVDGVASTYILYTALLKCGANVDYEIPDRIKDGYGININIIEEAYKDGINTIITCDNGIAAIDQVKRANELGITIVITDHHDIPYVLNEGEKEYLVPEASAVVNPKQEECKYPFEGLCGAVVAFKFIQVLYEEFNISKEELDSLLEIAAIATICDVMDLVEENRIIVKYGLKLLKNTSNLGIRALLEINNIPLTKLSVYHIGFIIGPCLNASGRLDTAKKGLELLLSKTKVEADTLALELKTLNDVRKEMTLKGFEKALQSIEENHMNEDKVLVVYLNNCHESLAGIIAGRLKEKFNKPAIVLTDSEHGAKGSCRSIEQYNIYEELTKCKDLLIKYGGHPMAAGLSLSYDNIDILRETLNQNTTLTKEDLVAKVVIDVILPFSYVSEELVEELELLEPFGKGNQKPIFAEKNVRILKASLLGKDKNVLKLRVVNEYNREMEALYFGNTIEFINEMKALYGENEVDKMFVNRDNNIRLSITYYPSINEYGGKRNTQIIIQNYQLISTN